MRTPRSAQNALALAFALSALIASFVCVPAHAVMITLEPDDYAVGTDVSNLLEGATLTRFNSNIVYSTVSSTEVILRDPSRPFVYTSPVYVEEASNLAATGAQSLGNFGLDWTGHFVASCWFGRVDCSAYNVFDDPFYALVIQFHQPTNYIEISGSSGEYNNDNFIPVVDIYGSNGQYMGRSSRGSRTYSPDNSGPVRVFYQVGSLERAPFIQTVFIGGQSAMGNVDRISYNSVPEPSTLLLLGVGLAGVAAWRRRQCFN